MSLATELAPPPAAISTPCLGVCQIDEMSGLCKGCARNGEEIAAWQHAGPDYKLRVWDNLSRRRASARLNAYRLPWASIDIACMIERTLRRRWGRWVLGLDGAYASFEIGADEDADILSCADRVTAISARGAIRLARHEKTIAVAFGNAANENGPDAIGLVLPKGRVDLRKGGTLTKVGPDRAAIAGSREDQLYDLGILDDGPARIYLRTDDMALDSALDRSAGRLWRETLEELDPLIDPAKVHTIAETGLGRIEIFSRPICGGDLMTKAELDIQRAGLTAALPPEWALPNVFSLCALFYPHGRKPASAFLDGHY